MQGREGAGDGLSNIEGVGRLAAVPKEDSFGAGTGGGLGGVESESRQTWGSSAGVHKS